MHDEGLGDHHLGGAEHAAPADVEVMGSRPHGSSGKLCRYVNHTRLVKSRLNSSIALSTVRPRLRWRSTSSRSGETNRTKIKTVIPVHKRYRDNSSEYLYRNHQKKRTFFTKISAGVRLVNGKTRFLRSKVEVLYTGDYVSCTMKPTSKGSKCNTCVARSQAPGDTRKSCKCRTRGAFLHCPQGSPNRTLFKCSALCRATVSFSFENCVQLTLRYLPRLVLE